MRLGKALATGVAEEQVPAHEEGLQLRQEVDELEASVEEVPVARGGCGSPRNATAASTVCTTGRQP